MTMHARLSALRLATGYLLKEIGLEEKRVISRSATLRFSMEPWKGKRFGKWNLQSPQICLAFDNQASCRSGAGIRSVEKDCDIHHPHNSFGPAAARWCGCAGPEVPS